MVVVLLIDLHCILNKEEKKKTLSRPSGLMVYYKRLELSCESGVYLHLFRIQGDFPEKLVAARSNNASE